MTDDLILSAFEHRAVGEHGAFLLRTNHEHVAIARKAVAHRLDVPVGVMTVDWPWLRRKAGGVVAMVRRAA